MPAATTWAPLYQNRLLHKVQCHYHHNAHYWRKSSCGSVQATGGLNSTVSWCNSSSSFDGLEPSITLFWFQVTTVLVACQKFYFHPTALLGLCLSVIVPYFQFGTLGWIKYWPIRNMNSRLRSDWSVILMISSVPPASAVLIWKLCGLCLYSSEICGGPNVILPQDLQHKF